MSNLFKSTYVWEGGVVERDRVGGQGLPTGSTSDSLPNRRGLNMNPDVTVARSRVSISLPRTPVGSDGKPPTRVTCLVVSRSYTDPLYPWRFPVKGEIEVGDGSDYPSHSSSEVVPTRPSSSVWGCRLVPPETSDFHDPFLFPYNKWVVHHLSGSITDTPWTVKGSVEGFWSSEL